MPAAVEDQRTLRSMAMTRAVLIAATPRELQGKKSFLGEIKPGAVWRLPPPASQDERCGGASCHLLAGATS